MENDWSLLDGNSVSITGNEPEGDECDASVSYGSASVYFSVLEENVQLLNGEQSLKQCMQLDQKLPKISPVSETNSKSTGVIYITSYQIIFQPKGSGDLAIKIPLRAMDRLELMLDYTVAVSTKHAQLLNFAFPSSDMQHQFMRRVTELNASHGPDSCFAYQNQEEFESRRSSGSGTAPGQRPVKKNGWGVYDPHEEFFLRQGVNSAQWRLTRVNEKFQICRSYPRVFLTPASIPDQVLERAAKFRTSGRLPTLCWISPRTSASVCRSSQPMVGLVGHRNGNDEDLIRAILSNNENDAPIYIIDCRPWSSAVANKAKGAGVESIENYQNSKLCFMNIDNIHTMRESLRAVFELLKSRGECRWLSALDATRWLEHLRLVLNAAMKIGSLIECEKSSVLVHCSDGWDRTSQLTSLAQLLLDPYYRTMKGFEVLIEKEWLAFGHKFADRCGHGKSMFADQECSPVFLQFIDCVWQLTDQFQCFFEFNEHFLITILDHLYSCRFGTFLFNTELERLKYKVRDKTKSLWAYINSRTAQYLNPIYQEHDGPLFPVCSAKNIQFWAGYYLRFQQKTPQIVIDETCRENLRTELACHKSATHRLEQEVAALKRLLEEQNDARLRLEAELGRAQLEKETLRSAVNCNLYREEGGDTHLVAKIQSETSNADLLSQFCNDLQSLQIIEDYKAVKNSPLRGRSLEDEDFVVVGEDGTPEPPSSPSCFNQDGMAISSLDEERMFLEIEMTDRAEKIRFPVHWIDYFATLGNYVRNLGLRTSLLGYPQPVPLGH